MNKYVDYQDLARLEYGRLLWRNPEMRRRLLEHWLDPRHPYRERFVQHRAEIERVLSSSDEDVPRALLREIPPVFGSFWK
ncbi:MAG: hypothetical protein N3A53_04275 [Verrucomicrobiae bacterium]|nr:hypothetical protein [Verrucomicrobiae bacterium]MCX7915501.1 hypothetical protein [Verrucomicrobiae bacterium]